MCCHSNPSTKIRPTDLPRAGGGGRGEAGGRQGGKVVREGGREGAGGEVRRSPRIHHHHHHDLPPLLHPRVADYLPGQSPPAGGCRRGYGPDRVVNSGSHIRGPRHFVCEIFPADEWLVHALPHPMATHIAIIGLQNKSPPPPRPP